MRIRDPGWKKFGTGIRNGKISEIKIWIREKHLGSATLPINCAKLFGYSVKNDYLPYCQWSDFPCILSGSPFQSLYKV